MEKGAIPAAKRNGGLSSMRVAASYACRARNKRPGAKLSEHAKGNAIDISAFVMRDGRTVTLISHWSGGRNGRMLREMWKSACGPFGTVLGPNSDRYHFHFDVARYRNGPFCR